VLVGGIVAPHNEFIRLAVELGVIGASLYIAFYVAIMLNAWLRAHAGRLLILLVGLGFLAFCYTDNAFMTATDYPMLFAVVYWALCLPPRNLPTVLREGWNAPQS
jgi:O-antigen ligase